MYRYVDFSEEKIATSLILELNDLAKTLIKDPEFEVELRVHSYLSRKDKRIYLSHFWNHRNELTVKAGLKSDVFLRAYGNAFFTNSMVVEKYGQWADQTTLSKLAKQLFVLLEDLRIEEECKRIRPGMKTEFDIRRSAYFNYFQTQMKANLQKSLFTDALFNLAYILLNSPTPIFHLPSVHDDLDPVLPLYQDRLVRLYEAKSTEDVAFICLSIIELLTPHLNKDLLNSYFHFHVDKDEVTLTKEGDYQDLMREDPLANQDEIDEKMSADKEYIKEEFKTWHRETSDTGKLFLQYRLDQGTKTNMLTDEARKGDARDQALSIVKGSSTTSDRQDYSEMEELTLGGKTSHTSQEQYGYENKYAEAIFLYSNPPKAEEIQKYHQYKQDIMPYQKRLKKIIDLTLERKKQDSRSDLAFGRLDKKLIRFFTEEHPKLFYKKSEDVKIDAVFSMLVDCSASMEDKMDETKKGIILFHEALKSVQVPHEVTGFWEDANDASETYQPNYFKQVISYRSSLKKNTGPEIMQLVPEEDNRDGFAIRIIGEQLVKRREKQKYLIVFSDGEPAAYGYHLNGIMDTQKAVNEVRQKGIEVINIFLAEGEVKEEQRKIFRNMYGPYSLVSPSVEELPDLLLPLLKRLLFKSIFI